MPLLEIITVVLPGFSVPAAHGPCAAASEDTAPLSLGGAASASAPLLLEPPLLLELLPLLELPPLLELLPLPEPPPLLELLPLPEPPPLEPLEPTDTAASPLPTTGALEQATHKNALTEIPIQTERFMIAPPLS
jgi:hypothetical protein